MSTVYQLQDNEQVTEAFQYLASCERKLVKNAETLEHISVIELLCENGGLSTDQFGLIVEQLTRLQCTTPLAKKLISVLVPSQPIPASILVDLTLWGLCHPSVDFVALSVIRVNILCLEYECVQDRQELVSLYELFLSMLDKDKLTGAIAELLHLLTSRSEVTEWRVRAVLRCQASQGSSHQLDSLLWRYRQWRPDLIPSCKAPASKKKAAQDALSKRFHKQWEARMDNSFGNNDGHGLWSGGLQIGNVFKKSQRTYLLPDKDILPSSKAKKNKVIELRAISDLRSLNELIDNIHQIQLPANILSILGNTGIIHILTLDESLMEKFSINIYHLLRNEFLFSDQRKIGNAEKIRKQKRRKAILELLIQLQGNVLQGLPVIGRFLTEFIEQWDGKAHFGQIMKLVTQLQISDYKEVFDCVISPILSNHFLQYSQLKQVVVLSNLHRLLRYWSVVEMDRFANHRRTVFPTNTINCTNALEAIHQLSVTIDEWSTLSLALSREKVESTHLQTMLIMTQYKLSQKLMIKYNIPMRLTLPSPFLYASLFSHSGVLMAMSCQYILTAKKQVLPMLRRALRDSELENGGEHPTSLTLDKMVSEEAQQDLLDATRDFLVFLSPGKVNLTPSSILRQGWDLPEGEESLKETLFISCHPAMLPFAMEHIESLDLEVDEKQRAWFELSQEQEDHSDNWATNISISEGRPKFVSNNFYSSKAAAKQHSGTEDKVVGNIFDFLKLLAKYLPPINDLIMEYKKMTSNSTNNLLPPASSVASARDTDLRSLISQQTEDSGVESLHPKTVKKRRSNHPSESENLGEGSRKSRRLTSSSSTPKAVSKKPALRPRSGALADVSNSRV